MKPALEPEGKDGQSGFKDTERPYLFPTDTAHCHQLSGGQCVENPTSSRYSPWYFLSGDDNTSYCQFSTVKSLLEPRIKTHGKRALVHINYLCSSYGRNPEHEEQS
ncbi:hypothetical protein GDO78_008846 [Eleutherodactylus coqui]|uniref:Uncharacterized protein n=1 Tax=Eleutherodactylus coqui TaxID=57060 RepID=A0A8J6FG24_ELECQ|nr:hypothetical protein GDO78_008846 [Eleutherodactylus coqui]